MFTTPSKRHYMSTLPPMRVGYDVTSKLPKFFQPGDTKLTKETQRGSGLLDFIRKTFKPLNNIESVVKSATTGKIPTVLKTAWNRSGGFPGAFPGELHPMSKTKKGIFFNSYLGPSTQATKRLVRGDKPISRSDRAGMAHDIRFGLQSRNPALAIRQMRSADKQFIAKLKDLERQGEPKFNTRIGIRGIQFKNKMEDLGIWKRTKFHTPWKSTQPRHPGIKIAEEKLKELEQEGYGKSFMPGERLRKKILRDLKKKKFSGPQKKARKGGGLKKVRKLGLMIPRPPPRIGRVFRPMMIPGLIVRKIVPTIIRRIAKRLRIRPKQMGKGIKKEIIMEMKRKTKKLFGRGKCGGAIGIMTVLGIAGALTPLIPLGIEAGKFIIPKIIQLFTKKKKQAGKGLDKMFGNLLAAVVKKVALSGPGKTIKGFISKACNKLIVAIANIIKAVQRIPKPLKQIAKPVQVMGGPIVTKHIDSLMKLLSK